MGIMAVLSAFVTRGEFGIGLGVLAILLSLAAGRAIRRGQKAPFVQSRAMAGGLCGIIAVAIGTFRLLG